jgi:hypothetical protein
MDRYSTIITPDFLFSFFVLFHHGTKYNKKREPMRSLCIVPAVQNHAAGVYVMGDLEMV